MEPRRTANNSSAEGSLRMTDCTFAGEGAHRRGKKKKKKEFHCECQHSSKLRLILFPFLTSAPYLQVMKMRLWTPKDISVEGGRAIFISLGLFTFFTGRNINRNLTFSAAVIPVIKTCWQLKVKFIVTLGPGVRCHIKNWLCMQSWPWKQTQETRRDQRAAQWGSHHYSGAVQLGNVCVCVCVCVCAYPYCNIASLRNKIALCKHTW